MKDLELEIRKAYRAALETIRQIWRLTRPGVQARAVAEIRSGCDDPIGICTYEPISPFHSLSGRARMR